jgi:hypothetical protein
MEPAADEEQLAGHAVSDVGQLGGAQQGLLEHRGIVHQCGEVVEQHVGNAEEGIDMVGAAQREVVPAHLGGGLAQQRAARGDVTGPDAQAAVEGLDEGAQVRIVGRQPLPRLAHVPRQRRLHAAQAHVRRQRQHLEERREAGGMVEQIDRTFGGFGQVVEARVVERSPDHRLAPEQRGHDAGLVAVPALAGAHLGLAFGEQRIDLAVQALRQRVAGHALAAAA